MKVKNNSWMVWMDMVHRTVYMLVRNVKYLRGTLVFLRCTLGKTNYFKQLKYFMKYFCM